MFTLLFFYLAVNFASFFVTKADYYLTTIAGTGKPPRLGFRIDGTATSVAIYEPGEGWIDSVGNTFLCEKNLVRKIDTSGMMKTIVGNLSSNAYPTDIDSPALSRSFSPAYITGDREGRYLYITDMSFIYRYDTITDMIKRFVGSEYGFDGDGGLAINAKMKNCYGLHITSTGLLYFSDAFNSRIRVVNITTGIIQTFAGSGIYGSSGNGGPATSAQIRLPVGVRADTIGNVYFVDLESYNIRKVNTNGIISTYAGTGISQFNGDNLPATSTNLNHPTDLTIDSVGAIYFSEGYRVRRIDVVSGRVSTIAGTGTPGKASTSIQLATKADISLTTGIWLDSSSNVYFSEGPNNIVRSVVYATGTPSSSPTVNVVRSDSNNESLSSGEIAGIVIGATAGGLIVLGLLCYALVIALRHQGYQTADKHSDMQRGAELQKVEQKSPQEAVILSSGEEYRMVAVEDAVTGV